MNWSKFEQIVCEWFAREGYWAHRIARDERGAQPFDVIAIKGIEVIAVDCKVCSRPHFPLSRVEDNQRMAMKIMSARTQAEIYFLCYFKGKVYVIPFDYVEAAFRQGRASLRLSDFNVLFEYEGGEDA